MASKRMTAEQLAAWEKAYPWLAGPRENIINRLLNEVRYLRDERRSCEESYHRVGLMNDRLRSALEQIATMPGETLSPAVAREVLIDGE